LQQRDSQSDDLVNLSAALISLSALTWILEKYQSASAALPERMTKYAENLTV
jgi:hypothetical protein